MALLYDPGIFMPAARTDFTSSSWLMGWSDGVWCLHDLEPDGTVYLVDTKRQIIVWHTRVTASFAVPYEDVGALAGGGARRGGLGDDVGDLPRSGYCVGWRAEPLARLDRRLGPQRLAPLGTAATDAGSDPHADLRLDGFQLTTALSSEFLRRWGLDDDGAPWCTGRPRLGWFAA